MSESRLRGLSNLERINWCWRVFATAIAFAVFGVVGLILTVLVFPLLALIPMTPARRQRIAQLYILHGCFRSFRDFMALLGLLTWEVRGTDWLAAAQRSSDGERGRIIIANHPTLIDVVLLFSLIRDVSCVVGDHWMRNIFMRVPTHAAGYINADSDFETLFARSRETLDSGRSIIVFPEGTRTHPGSALNFRRGAARMALHCEAELLPVSISCEPHTLSKTEPWYRSAPRRVHLMLRFDEPIPVDNLGKENTAIATRKLNKQLLIHYNAALAELSVAQSKRLRSS